MVEWMIEKINQNNENWNKSLQQQKSLLNYEKLETVVYEFTSLNIFMMMLENLQCCLHHIFDAKILSCIEPDFEAFQSTNDSKSLEKENKCYQIILEKVKARLSFAATEPAPRHIWWVAKPAKATGGKFLKRK